MTKSFKTTKADFKLFKSEVEYWVEKFHLREWGIRYSHEKSKKLPDSLAWVATDWKGRTCTIGLNPDWGPHDIVCDFELSRSAFHEVCELLLSDIRSIAHIDICPTQEDELDSKVHSIIRRMEWAVFEPDYKKRKRK